MLYVSQNDKGLQGASARVKPVLRVQNHVVLQHIQLDAPVLNHGAQQIRVKSIHDPLKAKMGIGGGLLVTPILIDIKSSLASNYLFR